MKLYVVITVLLLSVIDVCAQRSAISKPGLFNNLHFLLGSKDTITLIVAYNNIVGKVRDEDMDTFSAITKIDGSNFKKFTYAIGFKIPGYDRSFYVPCKDNATFSTLSSSQNKVSRLKLNCVVYRFFFTDGINNFFCINKASIVN